MAQGKKKNGVYGEGCFDFCMGKGVDCVIRGERNLCTILGGFGFTALLFLGEFLRAAGRLSRQRRRTGGSDEGRLRAQRAVGQICNSHSWPCCRSRRGTDAFCRIMLWAKRAVKGAQTTVGSERDRGSGWHTKRRGLVVQLAFFTRKKAGFQHRLANEAVSHSVEAEH
jgi:hypothetical protein